VISSLSDLHVALGKIERTFDATRLNEIVNDPSVYPWVKGSADGPLDLTDILASPSNVCLMGEHGGVLFAQFQPGLYEAHVPILPEGNGRWAFQMLRAALHWIFTRTNAVEIVTLCPSREAQVMARRVGGSYEFTSYDRWIVDGKSVPSSVYALRIQDWMRTAPGLEARGAWTLDQLEDEYARHGKSPSLFPRDPAHVRHIGAACEMLLGDIPNKGVIFFNRFAAMAGYAPMQIIDDDPLALDLGGSILMMNADALWMPTCRLAA